VYIGLANSAGRIAVEIAPCQQQINSADCGLFAIAFAVELAFGNDPSFVSFDQSAMRAHFCSCLENGFTPFPQLSNALVPRSRLQHLNISVADSKRTPWDGTLEQFVEKDSRKMSPEMQLPKKLPNSPEDGSDDDLGDFVTSQDVLDARRLARREKKQRKYQEWLASFRFKTVEDRKEYYFPAFKAVFSQDCLEYLEKVSSGAVDSDFMFWWTLPEDGKPDGLRRKPARDAAKNAHPLTDGSYMEDIFNQLLRWMQAKGELNAEHYIWAVWLPEAVKFGLIHGLNMSADEASAAMSAPYESALSEINRRLIPAADI
jgi:hypothetical protein